MNSLKNKFAVVLPAGGLGKRMGGTIPKQLMEIRGKKIFRYSLETFAALDEVAEIVLAVPCDWKDVFEREIFEDNSFDSSKIKIVIGGKERWESVRNGVEALTSQAEFVLVHDVARPFLSQKIILEVCETLLKKGACLVAKPAVDTVKIIAENKVQKTIDRRVVWLAQTPQAASINLLKNLYKKIESQPLDFTPTDEASILEYFNEPVFIVEGNSLNDKITTPEDFERFR